VTGAFDPANIQPTLLTASGSEMALAKCAKVVMRPRMTDFVVCRIPETLDARGLLGGGSSEEWERNGPGTCNSLAENLARPGTEIH